VRPFWWQARPSQGTVRAHKEAYRVVGWSYCMCG
jgi:hypothetical protein